MQSPGDYIKKTESAVRHLFNGIDEYRDVLRASPVPVFVSRTPPGPALDTEFETCARKNSEPQRLAKDAIKEYIAESFAIATLYGAVLQIAAKALEVYSKNTNVPNHLSNVVKPSFAKYCVGRLVRTVPLGLVVYAGRNQHTHFNDKALNKLNTSIFELLMTCHGIELEPNPRDDNFDFSLPETASLATKVTWLIGWHNYDSYHTDLASMLGI